MKKLELKTVEINVGGQAIKLSYRELVDTCLKSVGKDGIQFEEMKKRMRIDKSLAKAKEALELEDADVPVLQKLVKEMTWTIVHPAIVEFCEAVEKME